MWATLNDLFSVPIGSKGEKMRGRINKRRGGMEKTNERKMGVC